MKNAKYDGRTDHPLFLMQHVLSAQAVSSLLRIDGCRTFRGRRHVKGRSRLCGMDRCG